MSIIEATSAGVKDMADGSLRITFEFEPRHAADAFALFGVRGRAVAVAALKDGAGVVTEPAAEQSKAGSLTRSAGIICNDLTFQVYAKHMGYAATHEGAAQFVRIYCQVESRRELDSVPTRYARLMQDYRDWQKEIA